MPYTPPLGSAIELNFTANEAGYTAELGNNLSLSFVPPGPASQSAAVSGFITGQFGTPLSSVLFRHASEPPGTLFGSPSSPYLQTCGALGFSLAYLGRPILAIPPLPIIVNLGVSAASFSSTQFGTPTVAASVGVLATSIGPTVLCGAPKALIGMMASAVSPTANFGAPTSSRAVRATGGVGTKLGVPTSTRIALASSTYQDTRWGLGKSARSGSYAALGLSVVVRFGHPKAAHVNAFLAVSTPSSVQFGSPACRPKYRALHLAPGTRLGKPLMIRNPPC